MLTLWLLSVGDWGMELGMVVRWELSRRKGHSVIWGLEGFLDVGVFEGVVIDVDTVEMWMGGVIGV